LKFLDKIWMFLRVRQHNGNKCMSPLSFLKQYVLKFLDKVWSVCVFFCVFTNITVDDNNKCMSGLSFEK
jgi:hypothetical protein